MNNKDGLTMKDKILQVLESAHGYVSGEQISRELSVSRTAIWKTIQSLRAAGYPIESVRHHGYRLTGQPDVLTPWSIGQALVAQGVHDFGRTVYHETVVDSTNMAARRALEEGAPDLSLFIADEQTAGRGRRGRQWQSDHRQGLWFSLLLRPQATPTEMSRLTLFAGLCVAQAIRQLSGLDAAVKWPNDIIILPSGQKICGILTEMVVEENQVTAVILGIGVNVSIENFPAELTAQATSLRLASGQLYRRVDILAAILRVFEMRYGEFLPSAGIAGPVASAGSAAADNSAGLAGSVVSAASGGSDISSGLTAPASSVAPGIPAGSAGSPGSRASSITGETGRPTLPAWLSEYRQLCATLGRTVVLTDNQGQQRQGQAIDLSDSGDLIVAWPDGQRETVHAGEVSVRGLLGYS